MSQLPLLTGCPLDVLGIEQELRKLPHLDGDERCEIRGAEHRLIDARQAAIAADALSRIPGVTEDFHLINSGRFALWDFVPAVLDLAAPETIAQLYVATLGFSKANIEPPGSLGASTTAHRLGPARRRCRRSPHRTGR